MLIDNFLQNCRYALRNLSRDPFLVLVATGTLALCMAANTAVFSVADSILIRPLPYPNSSRIDWISERTGPNQEDVGVAPDYFAIREQSRIFEDVAAFDPGTANWTGVERPEQLEIAMVSPEFFHVLGTQPLRGRSLAADEVGPKAPSVAILSYAFWRNRLGSDPHIVGKTIALDRGAPARHQHLIRNCSRPLRGNHPHPRRAEILRPNANRRAGRGWFTESPGGCRTGCFPRLTDCRRTRRPEFPSPRTRRIRVCTRSSPHVWNQYDRSPRPRQCALL
jgi:hypothetical protein